MTFSLNSNLITLKKRLDLSGVVYKGAHPLIVAFHQSSIIDSQYTINRASCFSEGLYHEL